MNNIIKIVNSAGRVLYILSMSILLLTMFHLQNISAASMQNDNKDQSKRGKIVVSIGPLASIIGMLVQGEDIDMVVIQSRAKTCAHDYHLVPSDYDNIKDAQLLFLIDERFELFADKLFNKSSGRVVRASDFPDINFMIDKKVNWHFWLDLDNVMKLQSHCAKILTAEFPRLEGVILRNEAIARGRIIELKRLKSEMFRSRAWSDIIILSRSIEHFFSNIDNKEMNIISLYSRSGLHTLREIQKIDEVIKHQSKKCILKKKDRATIDKYENIIESSKKFGSKIVEIDSEDWRHDNKESFYNSYLGIINALDRCK